MGWNEIGQFIGSGTCDATFATGSFEIWRYSSFSIETKSVDSATTYARTGTITLEVGNEVDKWETKATLATVTAGAALDRFDDNISSSARYARLVFTRTAGAATETITFTVVGKAA